MSSIMQTYQKILDENLEILEKKPDDIASLYNCGTLLMNYKHDYAGAAKMFDRVLEIDDKVRIYASACPYVHL